VSKALLAILYVVFVLIVGDCVSTYLCLTTPVPESISVWEANPLSEWMFQHWGIVSGLVIFLLTKVIGLIIIWKWAHTSPGHMLLFLILMSGAVLVTAYVNYNNFYIYYLLVTL
jgi:hypothetical protein